MVIERLSRRAKEYLNILCNQIPNRRVGGEGNRLATSFFAEITRSFGFQTECPEFDCVDWQDNGATIGVDGVSINAQVSPYSLGVQADGQLVAACTARELKDLDITNKIVLMRGELTKEQFLPRNFPFFQVEEQQRIVQLLETKKPLAIITATKRNPEMAGALYPFPVFEDGDFDIPSVFITDEQGTQLVEHEGEEVSVEIKAMRIPSRGHNVVARKGGDPSQRVVLFAHIDAKVGTPGALDNGTGVVTLLLLAELLKNYSGNKTIEIVALNGEDYYSNPGEQLYLRQNDGKLQEIALGINIDGLGYIKGRTAYSLYECPLEIRNVIEQTFLKDESFVQGEPWFQGDHAIFLMNGRPALALTSELVYELMSEIVHTDRDTPGIIDLEKIARTAMRLCELITNL